MRGSAADERLRRVHFAATARSGSGRTGSPPSLAITRRASP